jgi:hypothetical protein
MAYENHWLPGFNFNVEEWDAEGQTYETLAICTRSPSPAPHSTWRSRERSPGARAAGTALADGWCRRSFQVM